MITKSAKIQSGRIGVIKGMRRPLGTPDLSNRVAGWVRARFALSANSAIMVSELRCQVPGCPPVETAIAFWDAAGERYRLKIFKPLAEVAEDDLPPGWLLPALIDEGEAACGCCG